MILSLIGGGAVNISEETGRLLDPVITRENPPPGVKFPDSDGEPVTVKTAQITGIWTDEQWAMQLHEKAGDVKCAFGFWHAKREPCGHQPPPPEPMSLAYLREGTDPTGQRSEYQDKFATMIKFNLEWAASHPLPNGMVQHGPFRTVAEWDLYQSEGVLPADPPRKGRTKWISVPESASPFPTPGERVKRRAVEVGDADYGRN